MSEADAAIAAAGDGEPGAGIESAGVPATARAEVHDGDGVDAKGFAPLDGSGLDVSASDVFNVLLAGVTPVRTSTICS